MSVAAAFDPFAARLSAFGAWFGARSIRAGDETAFRDAELESTPANLARRRASGAARLLAAHMFARLGLDDAKVGRAVGGAPAWPTGLIGSIAHDETTAIVAFARAGGAIKALGVDIEPAEPLPDDLADYVLTQDERRSFAGDPLAGRMIFAAKEAVYKAVYPLDGAAPDYADILCDAQMSAATLRDGRRLALVTAVAPRVLAAAFLLS